MKKVLLVGQIWPHHKSAGNCIHAIAKYLPEFGWQPVVLTTPLPDKTELKYRVIEVHYRDWLKSLLTLLGFSTDKSIKKQLGARLGVTAKKSPLDFIFLRLREVLTYPDQFGGWRKPAIRSGDRLIQEDDIKAIISDCPPATGLLVSGELKRRNGIPWLVYFSHLWSQNNGYPYSSFRRFFERRLELKTLSPVDAMITHSQPLVDKLKELHKNKEILAAFEGFDPETVNEPPVRLSDKFTITYTGSFAPGLREPAPLFKALGGLLSRGIMRRDELEVRFYGLEEAWINSEIDKYGLSDVVKQYGRVPMAVAQLKQRESQVLYNPKWNDPDEPGIYSGKMFEYLAARRPILAIGKYRDVVDQLLEDTGAGISVSSQEDTEKVLTDMYRQYQESGQVGFSGDISKLAKLSHRELAQTFARLLNQLCK